MPGENFWRRPESIRRCRTIEEEKEVNVLVNFLETQFGRFGFEYEPVCEEGKKIRIQQFHFPPNVKEGHKVQVMCGLLEGDTPVHFTWQRNGESFSSSNNVNIMTHPDFSRLVINDVDVQSSGNYTCIAKNNQGQDSYTAHLAVRGPPKWLREPSDTSTSVGESVTLSCATFGYPTPDVTWRKANDSSPDHWIHLVNNRHIRLESNGSLTIINVQNEDSGYYECQVSNGIGEGLKKTVSVSIKGKMVANSTLEEHFIHLCKCEKPNKNLIDSSNLLYVVT
ncbi:down syndrome cell adhesion molecule homolog [Trichonephila clavipes]|nr:down syndrome cell adhesion molecule homolog [Trichonephila clavipes]